MGRVNISIILSKEHILVYAKKPEENSRHVVTVRWLRPISGIGKEVVLLKDKEEFYIVKNIDELDVHSRVVIEDELKQNYIVPQIFKILDVTLRLGNRYFEVETDHGKCSFIVKNPFINIRNTGDDGILIRDVLGNMFRIP